MKPLYEDKSRAYKTSKDYARLKKLLDAGYCITGKNLHREIAALNPDICDIDSAKSTISVKNLCAVNIY